MIQSLTQLRCTCMHALLLGALVFPLNVSAQSPTFKSAVATAIDQGQASLWLPTAMAEPINEAVGRPANERIRVLIERLHSFNPNCARLNFRYRDTSNESLFDMGMNLCKDGSPPIEGVDLSKLPPHTDVTPVPKLERQ